jgi:hypothetical protein
VEARAKDVAPVRMTFDFWGDDNGCHLQDANGDSPVPSANLPMTKICTQPTEGLKFEHHRDALANKILQPSFDGMLADDAYRFLCDNDLSSLPHLRFCTASEFETLSQGEKYLAVVVTDDYAAKFGGSVPGFPNAIRYDEFVALWNAVRGEPSKQ